VLSPASSQAAEEMSRRCFGYGEWSAPYWFIGPEQGLAREELDHDLGSRFQAFLELESDGLCDCKEFHLRIQQAKYFVTSRGKRHVLLQPTWRRTILALLSYKGQLSTGQLSTGQLSTGQLSTGQLSTDKSVQQESIRNYQSELWGRMGLPQSETCVVELSGIPARSLGTTVDRETNRCDRLDPLHKEIEKNQPQFVVVYGKSQHKHWRELWSKSGSVNSSGDCHRMGATKIVFATQPTAHGQTDMDWINLGQRLRA